MIGIVTVLIHPPSITVAGRGQAPGPAGAMPAGPGASSYWLFGQDDERVDVDPRVPRGAEHLDDQLVRAVDVAVTTSTISAVLGEVACVLMVAAVPESSLTVAEPRVGPCVDIQAAWKPVKVSVAVLPAAVAKSTDPPLAPESVCRVQPAEYLIALAFSWSSDSL